MLEIITVEFKMPDITSLGSSNVNLKLKVINFKNNPKLRVMLREFKQQIVSDNACNCLRFFRCFTVSVVCCVADWQVKISKSEKSLSRMTCSVFLPSTTSTVNNFKVSK